MTDRQKCYSIHHVASLNFKIKFISTSTLHLNKILIQLLVRRNLTNKKHNQVVLSTASSPHRKVLLNGKFSDTIPQLLPSTAKSPVQYALVYNMLCNFSLLSMGKRQVHVYNMHPFLRNAFLVQNCAYLIIREILWNSERLIIAVTVFTVKLQLYKHHNNISQSKTKHCHGEVMNSVTTARFCYNKLCG